MVLVSLAKITLALCLLKGEGNTPDIVLAPLRVSDDGESAFYGYFGFLVLDIIHIYWAAFWLQM